MIRRSICFAALVSFSASSDAFIVSPTTRDYLLRLPIPKGIASSPNEQTDTSSSSPSQPTPIEERTNGDVPQINGNQRQQEQEEKNQESESTLTNKEGLSSNDGENGASGDGSPQHVRRSMELTWCGREYCSDVIRERIVGNENNMEFEGPATGQVCYVWGDPPANQKTPSVLLLVKQGDDELLQCAANVINQLLDRNTVQIQLSPDICARLKHYYGVNDDKIKLFEPTPHPGFGGSHVATDDTFMGKSRKRAPSKPNPDLICTLGGDGLLMHASMLFPGACPPILCVAGGSLGFLTPFSKDELVDAIEISLGISKDEKLQKDVEENDPVEIRPSYGYLKESAPRSTLGLGNRVCLSMRMRLDVRIINREGVVRARFNVLNEVVIDRGSSPYLAALECFVDDVHLTTVQADGVIFATPTGSTAYSMAAGGSVVHPAVPAILVTPICPHVLSFRSMVFPDSVVLRCYVPDDARSDACVAFDGKYRRELHRGDSVQVQMSQHPVPTINRADHSADWLSSLKRNFNFNTRARQRPL